jgi:hypothetical protein
MITPKVALISSWARNRRLRRVAASSSRRCSLQVVRAREPDQAVSEIFALNQDEDHEDDDDAGCRQGIEQRRYQGPQVLQCSRIRLADFDRNRSDRRCIWIAEPRGRPTDGFVFLWLVEFPAQFLKHIGSAFQRAAACRRTANGLDLFAHRRLINRKVAGELGKLICDQGTQTEDNHERQDNDAYDRKPSGNTCALQQPDKRSEDKTEKNCQSDGYEYFSAEIQRGNKQRCQNCARDGAQQSRQLFRRAAGVNFSGDQAHGGRLGNSSGDEKVPPRTEMTDVAGVTRQLPPENDKTSPCRRPARQGWHKSARGRSH